MPYINDLANWKKQFSDKQKVSKLKKIKEMMDKAATEMRQELNYSIFADNAHSHIATETWRRNGTIRHTNGTYTPIGIDESSQFNTSDFSALFARANHPDFIEDIQDVDFTE
jgi:hypothetical protein